MELRLDRLLQTLRDQPAAVLAAIDRDPLLLKKESGGLVLANASQELYTPQAEHQLFAKGIVYRRDPYRVVSLPLVKIYNLGERDVTAADLTALAAEPRVSLRFLRKIDGSLVQVFRHDGRVWFTTRGTLEGARPRRGQESGEDRPDFDYLATARRLAAERYPRLLDDPALLKGRTLIFELIHPGAPKVTNYGGRADLILLACFDQRRFAYAPYPEVEALGSAHGLAVVDALSPAGDTLAAQIDNLLAVLAGTDQEGSVVTFERPDEVIYRVKVKSPDYLRLMRVMAACTYENTAALLEENPHLTTWAAFEAFLRARGREVVPEEVLIYYRPHFEQFVAYLADCERLCEWGLRACRELQARLGERLDVAAPSYRKGFAALAGRHPLASLLFAALDGRLDRERIRRTLRTPEQVREALREAGPTS